MQEEEKLNIETVVFTADISRKCVHTQIMSTVVDTMVDFISEHVKIGRWDEMC
jgi:hypothetical protein